VLHPVKKKKKKKKKKSDFTQDCGVRERERTEAIVNIHECTVLRCAQWLCNHHAQRCDKDDGEHSTLSVGL
jgi:pimeloyl-CoA synthetase